MEEWVYLVSFFFVLAFGVDLSEMWEINLETKLLPTNKYSIMLYAKIDLKREVNDEVMISC